ncbi:MAG: hypothetical protein EA352_12025, partial [Gemmatimonadales bacterium]
PAAEATPGDTQAGDPGQAEEGEALELIRLSDMEIEAPEGVEDRVPFPSTASIRNLATPEEGLLTVAFQANAVLEELADLLSAFFEESDWEVREESIGEATAGEVGADWRVAGHGVRVSVTLIGFDGAQSSQVSGSLIVLADD